MTRFCTVSLLFLLFAGCDNILSSSSDGQPVQLEVDITAEQVKTLQDIEGKISAINISNRFISYGFPSSCQFGFKIEKNDSVIFDSQSAYGCLAVITQLELNPQESKSFSFSLKSMEGPDSLSTGQYQVEAFILAEDSPRAATSFTVE